MNTKYNFIFYSIMMLSCTHTVTVNNEKRGELTATYHLVVNDEKRILLDNETAPCSPYIQMIEDTTGTRLLTFLNPYKNSIYYYDYEKEFIIGRINYEKEGPNGILWPTGYYIKNMDSIYVYNRRMLEIALTDSAGRVKRRISLRDDQQGDIWTLYFPQYLFNTVIPIIEIQGMLILTGFYHSSISSKMIDLFLFTACIDIKTSEIKFMFKYPGELYGSDSNWEGGLATLVYPEISPTGEIIHSFPVSHDLYITSWNSAMYKTVYAGSNTASTIHSIDWETDSTPAEVILAHIAREDMYTAIRYDSWRKVYYRILLKGIPNATHSTPKEKKPITIIIMDEQFNYLGETVIGDGEQWNWKNIFVTREGLNIEYLSEDDLDEDYMIFKIFTIEKKQL